MASPSTVTEFKPMLSTVSIIPGMETAAPDRHENSSGFSVSPYFLPISDSTLLTDSLISSHISIGRSPYCSKTLHKGVVRVNPGGTSTPMRDISCRPTPFPPTIVLSGLPCGLADPPNPIMGSFCKVKWDKEQSVNPR